LIHFYKREELLLFLVSRAAHFKLEK